MKLMPFWMTILHLCCGHAHGTAGNLPYYVYAAVVAIGPVAPETQLLLQRCWFNACLCFTWCSSVFLRNKKLGAHRHKSQVLFCT